MGREIKRVALDFNWPLEEVWPGFVNYFYNHCAICVDCDGTGEARGGHCGRCKGEGDIWDSQ